MLMVKTITMVLTDQMPKSRSKQRHRMRMVTACLRWTTRNFGRSQAPKYEHQASFGHDEECGCSLEGLVPNIIHDEDIICSSYSPSTSISTCSVRSIADEGD